jgi:nitroreductase
VVYPSHAYRLRHHGRGDLQCSACHRRHTERLCAASPDGESTRSHRSHQPGAGDDHRSATPKPFAGLRLTRPGSSYPGERASGASWRSPRRRSSPITVTNLLHCLETHRSVKPAGLGEPGPNPDELRRLLTMASRVPDHGALVSWRFILFHGDARQAASAQLAAAYSAQHPDLSEQTVGTLAKLSRLFAQAPLVVAVVSRADPNARKPEWEQVLTAGAVCMNLITAATALGYASVCSLAGRPITLTPWLPLACGRRRRWQASSTLAPPKSDRPIDPVQTSMTLSPSGWWNEWSGWQSSWGWSLRPGLPLG